MLDHGQRARGAPADDLAELVCQVGGPGDLGVDPGSGGRVEHLGHAADALGGMPAHLPVERDVDQRAAVGLAGHGVARRSRTLTSRTAPLSADSAIAAYARSAV